MKSMGNLLHKATECCYPST